MTATAARSPGAGAATADPSTGGPGSFTHRQIMTVISGLLLGMFLAALDQTVVSTAIRTIADDLHGYSEQAWATTAFLITSTIATPLYGKLSDQFGRKPLYLTAISLFVIGSMLCGLSRSMYELAAFRAFQGLGAGGLMSLAFAILGDMVSPRERSRYQGYFMAVFASSSVLGPLIGGLLAGQHTLLWISGWRWIFYVNVPIGLAAFFVIARVLKVSQDRRAHRIDWPGALSLTACLVPLLIVAEQGRAWGWGSDRALLCYAIGLAGLVGFLLSERAYGEDALLPLRLFGDRTFSVGVLASAIVGIGMFGGLVLLPQYLQVVKGSSPTLAGLQTIPLVLGITLVAMVSGRAISRTGRYRIFPIIGTLVMTGAMLLFHTIGADTPLWQTMIYMFLFGAGLGLNMQPVILAVQNSVAPREMGVATSSVTFFRQIGGSAGTAVFLSVLFSILAGKITSAVTAAAGTPAYQKALAAHPAQAKTLKGGATGALSDTSFISRLDPVLAHPFKVGFSNAIDVIFLIAAVILAVGFVVTLFLPEKPLRTTGGLEAAQAEAKTSTAVAASAAASAPSSSEPIVDEGASAGTAAGESVERTAAPVEHHPHPAHRADEHAHGSHSV